MKAHTLPVLVCLPNDESKDENKKDKPVIEKSAQPKWMQEYEKYIKDKKPSLPIKLHPLLMCDKDTAIAEYDRLYDILKEPYVRVYASNQSKEEADRFIKSIIDGYIDLWVDVQEYNDKETRRMCADDTSELKNFMATLGRAKRMELQWESDGVHFRITEIKVLDNTKNSDALNADGGVNEMLFADIVSRLTGQATKLTPSHMRWREYQKVISECVEKRLYFDTDMRTAKREIAMKCRALYDSLMNNPECLSKSHNHSDEAVKLLVRILGISISKEEEGRFKDLIQGKK